MEEDAKNVAKMLRQQIASVMKDREQRQVAASEIPPQQEQLPNSLPNTQPVFMQPNVPMNTYAQVSLYILFTVGPIFHLS